MIIPPINLPPKRGRQQPSPRSVVVGARQRADRVVEWVRTGHAPVQCLRVAHERGVVGDRLEQLAVLHVIECAAILVDA